MEKYREIEKSIIKKYRKEIWSPFVKTIKKYNLIEEGDKIAVCISGGKDGFLLAKCLDELQRHGIFKFELVYLTMDPGFNKNVIDKIYEIAKLLNINLHVFKTNIFDVTNKLNHKSPCYICAKMRRGYLYDEAKKLGCNKIALGHHFNDVIETVMMNMIYNGTFSAMLPKLKSANFEGMELIRPLYDVHEENIITWVNYNKLEFANCACPIAVKQKSTKREEVKKLIEDLKINLYKDIDKNILKATENVNTEMLLAFYENVNEMSNDKEEN